MNNKQKIAITNVIRAAENPDRYGIKTVNSEEQNNAIVKALKTLFDVDENGTVLGFNDETVEAFFGLTERPSIEII